MSEDQGKTFSEQEVAIILQRAAQLQQMEGGEGINLIELERIAQEAGLEPAHVRQAALDLENRPFIKPLDPLFNTTILFEKTLSQAVTEAELDTLAEVITAELTEPGTFQRVGHSLTWTTTPRMAYANYGNSNYCIHREIAIKAYSHNGSTTIRVEEKFKGLSSTSLGIWVMGLGGGLTGPAVVVGFLLFRNFWAVLALVGTGLWQGHRVARQMMQTEAQNRTEQLQRLYIRLLDQLRTGQGPA